MDTHVMLQLISVLCLLALSAFFSSGETALVTVNRIKIQSLAESGNKTALILQKVLNHNGRMLSTILIGNNIVNLSASAITTTLAIDVFGNVAVGIATGILTISILIFGEILPKTWASYNSEQIALAYAPIIYILMKILTPAIYIVDKISTLILRIIGIDKDTKSIMTENELRTYVDVSHKDGVIESEERTMIYNVFEFGDSVAKDIMIPRIDMTGVDENASYHELIALFKSCMYTRIPVYRTDDKDHIIGLVNIKDMLFVEDVDNFSISDILREGYYTYEYKKTADLMPELRDKTGNVAFVLDEYGACVGMITLEDLLEEIVGEIRDEYDEDEEGFIQQLDDTHYSIEANMKLDDINDAINTNLESEDYDSIGGIVIEMLGRLPEVGDTVTTTNNIGIEVKEIINNRITKVILTIPPSINTENDEININSL